MRVSTTTVRACAIRGDGRAFWRGLSRCLNRVYLPHRQLKWQRHLTTGLTLVPDRLAERLESLSNGRPEEALQAAEALLAEIVTLADAHCDADIGALCEALPERRQAIGPPSRERERSVLNALL